MTHDTSWLHSPCDSRYHSPHHVSFCPTYHPKISGKRVLRKLCLPPGAGNGLCEPSPVMYERKYAQVCLMWIYCPSTMLLRWIQEVMPELLESMCRGSWASEVSDHVVVKAHFAFPEFPNTCKRTAILGKPRIGCFLLEPYLCGGDQAGEWLFRSCHGVFSPQRNFPCNWNVPDKCTFPPQILLKVQ